MSTAKLTSITGLALYRPHRHVPAPPGTLSRKRCKSSNVGLDMHKALEAQAYRMWRDFGALSHLPCRALSSSVELCQALSGSVELYRALSSFVGLCRALSGSVRLCQELSARP